MQVFLLTRFWSTFDFSLGSFFVLIAMTYSYHKGASSVFLVLNFECKPITNTDM